VDSGKFKEVQQFVTMEYDNYKLPCGQAGYTAGGECGIGLERGGRGSSTLACRDCANDEKFVKIVLIPLNILTQ
jgi:hypothetical protein